MCISQLRFRWVRLVARVEKGRIAFKILTSKHKGKRLLGRPSLRCEDNTIIDFKEISINTKNWIDSS